MNAAKHLDWARWHVIDTHTRAVVRGYQTFRGASRAADRLDLAYGAVRYSVRPSSGHLVLGRAPVLT
jgi:hypothetical protein